MNKQLIMLVLAFFFLQCTQAQKKTTTMNPFNYEKAWSEVTDFESKGLPESALKTVNEIYAHAKADKNSGQLVKAVIHQLKFTDYKEENGFVKNLNRLKQEAEGASFPTKPILHSMLGEMYWQYYQNNRYEFANRSETVNADENDIETWSLAKIVKETFIQYNLSLQDVEKSKIEKVDVYEPVIYKGNELGKKYRPTLYDFIAHRAVDFYQQDEPDLIRPSYAFTLNKAEYLNDASSFATLKIETRDTISMKFHALIILQDLIRFHLDDKDPGALVDVDLQRLHFVKSNLTLQNKNDLYLKALEQLEARVKANAVVGKVTVEKAGVYVETAALHKPLQSDDHKWDLKKAYEICEEANKRFPDSDGAIMCENLQEDIRNKSVSAVIEENNLPNEPFRSLVSYRNFIDLNYRIIKVTRDEVRTLRRKLEKDYYSDREKKFLEYWLPKTPVKKGSFKLPDDGDYQSHNIEVKLDALPEGEYMVLYSNRADFATGNNALAYAFTVISNISYLHRNATDGGTEFFILNRKTGEPLAGVKADVFANKYNNSKGYYEGVKAGTFTSDATGYFKIPLMKREESRNFYVNFSKGADVNSTESIDRQNYYYGNGTLNQYKYEEPGAHTQTFFFLDRAIYRPGQTIYFKGLVVNTDGKNPKIIPGYSTTIRLLDVNYQEQGHVDVKANEYGTFSGTFTAPSTGLTGEMQLQNTDGSGNISFSVEEYKRPKFEVGFDPVKGSFRLNESIKVEGFARAYSGANIDGAQVKYRVVRVANFPFWWWCRWGYYPSSPEMEIISGETTSDTNGKFGVDF
jgi:hypothetical protein